MPDDVIFSGIDPLGLRQDATEIAHSAHKRLVSDILSSYASYFDLFSELIQNALDAIDKRYEQQSYDNPTINILINAKDRFVQVSDNGIGIAPGTLERQSHHSWGLMEMQERVSLLDGDFRIDSSPNVGTKITISIPYKSQDEQLHTSNKGMTHDN